jgi:hypothetical protein
MRKAISVIGVFLAAALALAASTLDGKTFAGQMTEKGKAQGDKDEFVFKNGMFRSTGCDSYGFTETAYTASERGGATRFEAESHSPKEGTMKWKGTVKGDAIEGTAVWSKKGQADITYLFQGTLKK